jgi:hypothetical protein
LPTATPRCAPPIATVIGCVLPCLNGRSPWSIVTLTTSANALLVRNATMTTDRIDDVRAGDALYFSPQMYSLSLLTMSQQAS